MSTEKKVTRVEGGSQASAPKTFVPTPESKSKATQLRLFAALAWLLAIAAQVFAISLLFKTPINMVLIIVAIVVDLAFAVLGSILWKKSNRLDPASEKNKFMFFMQSQLGLVVAVIAFLPLIIFILTSKNLDGKQKGILGGIAAVALIIAGITGYDFNPPSVEQYTQQAYEVEQLTGQDLVYWTRSGTRYHIDLGCHSINTERTEEIFEGSVAQARELKNISELCGHCRNRAMRERNLTAEDLIMPEETPDDNIE